MKYTLELKHDPKIGWFCLVLRAGKTKHGTGYYRTPEDARSAGVAWIEKERSLYNERAKNERF